MRRLNRLSGAQRENHRVGGGHGGGFGTHDVRAKTERSGVSVRERGKFIVVKAALGPDEQCEVGACVLLCRSCERGGNGSGADGGSPVCEGLAISAGEKSLAARRGAPGDRVGDSDGRLNVEQPGPAALLGGLYGDAVQTVELVIGGLGDGAGGSEPAPAGGADL